MFIVGGWEAEDRSEQEEISVTRTHIGKYYQRILGANTTTQPQAQGN